jgi:hypothetical protein
MNDQGRGILTDWDADDDAIADVMGDAIADALEEHKRAGVSIAVWDWDRNCVEIVPPEEIEIPDRYFHDNPVEAAIEGS